MGDIREAQADGQRKPLHILIAGAGIGGLSAAIALRQQGHQVDIFEQSKLSQETGAAIHLATNCNGLLRRMGLMAEQIGGVECTDVIEYLPHNGQVKYHIPAKKMSEKLWAHPWHLVHRGRWQLIPMAKVQRRSFTLLAVYSDSMQRMRLSCLQTALSFMEMLSSAQTEYTQRLVRASRVATSKPSTRARVPSDS
jgi:2-polyprenyl-6-methoxyphenol hydroxylase-like FAD-dependent oxidoreductase